MLGDCPKRVEQCPESVIRGSKESGDSPERVRTGSKESQERVQSDSGEGPERFRRGSRECKERVKREIERVQRESIEGP